MPRATVTVQIADLPEVKELVDTLEARLATAHQVIRHLVVDGHELVADDVGRPLWMTRRADGPSPASYVPNDQVAELVAAAGPNQESTHG